MASNRGRRLLSFVWIFKGPLLLAQHLMTFNLSSSEIVSLKTSVHNALFCRIWLALMDRHYFLCAHNDDRIFESHFRRSANDQKRWTGFVSSGVQSCPKRWKAVIRKWSPTVCEQSKRNNLNSTRANLSDQVINFAMFVLRANPSALLSRAGGQMQIKNGPTISAKKGPKKVRRFCSTAKMARVLDGHLTSIKSRFARRRTRPGQPIFGIGKDLISSSRVCWRNRKCRSMLKVRWTQINRLHIHRKRQLIRGKNNCGFCGIGQKTTTAVGLFGTRRGKNQIKKRAWALLINSRSDQIENWHN